MAEAAAAVSPSPAPRSRYDGYDRVPRPMRLESAPHPLDILFV